MLSVISRFLCLNRCFSDAGAVWEDVNPLRGRDLRIIAYPASSTSSSSLPIDMELVTKCKQYYRDRSCPLKPMTKRDRLCNKLLLQYAYPNHEEIIHLLMIRFLNNVTHNKMNVIVEYFCYKLRKDISVHN